MSKTGISPGIHNLAYLEQLYRRCQRHWPSAPPAWRHYFEAAGEAVANGTWPVGPSFRPHSLFNPASPPADAKAQAGRHEEMSLHERLNELIRNHRAHGHQVAQINPLGSPRARPSELELSYYGFTERELELLTNCALLPYDQPLSIREIYRRLSNTYCRSIGAQFMHIESPAMREWLQRRMESSQNRLQLGHDEQRRILTRLTEAVVFDEFLRKQFMGAKTFSLEGSEALLVLLDLAIEHAAELGVRHVVIGMTHRGRLNVVAHVLGKDIAEIFREFVDSQPELSLGRGDVRYHLGHSAERTTAGGHKIHLSLCFNPSHLEFVDPVGLGRVRAHQDHLEDQERREVLGVLIHGDAAFAGEGLVQETLNFSRLPGYRVGGVLHVILNNQLGFTTPPEQGRSTSYATDVARLLPSPIFHVNGEDPEAVAQAVRVAIDFRHEFRGDVFIDLYAYRRWGHNETDEPSFTQPVLYRAIQKRPSVREGYLQELIEKNVLSAADGDQMVRRRLDYLDRQLAVARQGERPPPRERGDVWRDYTGGPEPEEEPETSVAPDRLAALLHRLSELPVGFRLHPKLAQRTQAYQEMAAGKRGLDWAAAELLAFASLATEGVPVRLAGQDTARGTFSQRHAVVYDQETGDSYVPLQNLASDQASVEILNSPLNEAGALGFEYGYSLDCPGGLIAWEAQFGDFINAAQVIVDQFIASGEDKWNQLSGLTLLLPHGFEGMGPEHSSARLERFLALAAEDNLQIIQPTTPAQYFHSLRRQALWRWRKPLVIFTPKSLLRQPKVASSLEDCARDGFQRVWPDSVDPRKVRRVLLCTGKVYYELAARRTEHQRSDHAILRLEQLYPLRVELLQGALASYPAGTPVFWIQEEPENMGAWRYLRGRFGDTLFSRWPFSRISRTESASPATGSAGAHRLEQATLIRCAFGEGTNTPNQPNAQEPPTRPE